MVGSCGCDGCTDDSLSRFNLTDVRGISHLVSIRSLREFDCKPGEITGEAVGIDTGDDLFFRSRRLPTVRGGVGGSKFGVLNKGENYSYYSSRIRDWDWRLEIRERGTQFWSQSSRGLEKKVLRRIEKKKTKTNMA